MDAKVTALAIIDVIEGDKAFKADVIDELVDALIGDDPTALIKNVKGLPSGMVEVISDGVSDAIKEALKKKWGVV